VNGRMNLVLSLGFTVIAAPALWAQDSTASGDKVKKDTGVVVAATDPAPAPATSPAKAPPRIDAGYKIGPQDVLRIDVWKEPDLTRQVSVRPDGQISLPLLDDVQAAGLTPLELRNALRDGLKEYITDPQVTVTVSEINSRRIFVTGEVTRSGTFPLLPNMTVLQALSSCGGFTQFANTKKIYLLRMDGAKQVKIPVNYKDLVKGRKPEINILLQDGDTIVVP
jgi:polysaccharide export outer membrane protein